jgi:uncharacterized protein (DUF2236 family)
MNVCSWRVEDGSATMRVQAKREVRQRMVIPARLGPRRDPGFFGPDSVTWQVFANPVVVLIGAARNVLYTALSSEVSHAVNDHSTHYLDPINRALETIYWMYATPFGDTEEARRVGLWVQGRHAKVTGIDPVTNTDYSPSRPDLARKAHGLIWEASLIAYETYVHPLSVAQRDQYWREGFATAELLGIDTATLPPTWDAWRDYYDTEILPRLNLSPAAHRLVQFTSTGGFMSPLTRPPFRLAWNLLIELTLTTVGPTERGVFGQPRGNARLAATRHLGRGLVAAAALPPVRDEIERTYGPRIHELLSEARAIRAGASTTT